MVKCSHCGQQGHNSRTCTSYNNGNKGNGNGHSFKLFGVNIVEKECCGGDARDSIKKSRSMGNLVALSGRSGLNDVTAGADDRHHHDHEAGYLSDGVIHNVKRKAAHEKKRGKPWTEKEHRTFLAGLRTLGKGEWKGIASMFVTTRTPTQIASHAQKYFIRQQAPRDKKKRRLSLFDMPLTGDVAPQLHQVSSMNKPKAEASSKILNRFPHLSLDNYTVPVGSSVCLPAPNYLVPYRVGFPRNVQPWPMINIGRPSYLYNVPRVYGSIDQGAPIVVSHPSGIPPPRSAPSSPSTKAAANGAFSADQTDGLELKIGQPQPKQGSELSSPPASGAIRVT